MDIPAGSPTDVDPKYRKYAWPIYITLILGFIAFVIFTIVTAVGERSAPPTEVKIARLRYKQPGYVICFEDLPEEMSFNEGEDGVFCELTRAKRPNNPLKCQADKFELYQRTVDPTAAASTVLGQAMQETLFANDTAAGGGSGDPAASGDGYPDTYDFYGGDYSDGYNFDGGKPGSTAPYKTLSIKPCATPVPGQTACALLRKCMVFNADTVLKKKDKVQFGTWGWTFNAGNANLSYTESFVLNILLPECIPKQGKNKAGVIPNSTTEVDAFDKMLACMYKSALDPFDLAWGFNNGVPSMEQTKYLAGNTKREYDLALQPVSYVEDGRPRNDFLAVDVTMRTELVTQVEEQDPLNPTTLMGTIGGFWNYVALVFGFFFVKTMPVSGMAMFKFGALVDKKDGTAKDEEAGQAGGATSGKGEAEKAVDGAKKEAKKEAKDAAKDAAKEQADEAAGEAAGAIGLDSLSSD